MAIKQSTFYIILLLIGILLVVFFLAYPAYGEYALLNAELDYKKEELKNRERYIEGMENDLNRLSEYERELNMIDVAIPENFYESSYFLIRFIEKSTSDSGLTSDTMTVSFREYKEGDNKNSSVTLGAKKAELQTGNSDALSKTLRETDITLAVTGSYEAFKNFISTITNSSRLINIEKISFSSKNSGDIGSGIFTFNLTLKAFNY